MNFKTSLHFLYLFLLGAVFFWMGCDPDDDMQSSCDDNAPELVYGDYCAPNFQELRALEQADNSNAEIPDFCATDYEQSRIVKVAVPSGGTVYLHLYFNFPGKVFTELIGADCEGNFELLNSCQEVSEAVVKTFTVNASGFNTLYVRMRYEGTSTYSPGQREIDRLTVAAFDGPPALTPINGQSESANTVYQGCGNYTNRLILSPGNGSASPLQTAINSGLPYVSCDCSDGQLVTVTAPVGVDINAGVRPKIKEKDAAVDTVRTGIDFIIPIPALNFQDQPDPRELTEIRENECLDFSPTQVGQGNKAGIKVTIVDSGVDFNTHGGVFSAYWLPGGTASCLPSGDYGADLINADEQPDDEIGHGTSVASALLSGYSSESPLNLIHNKFFGPDGGTLFDALCASYAGLSIETDLLNLSWGFESTEEPAALISLLNQAQSQDVIVVCSAGNNGQNLEGGFAYWPALAGGIYDNVITVASFDGGIINDPMATYWTNFGDTSPRVAAFYTANTLSLGSLSLGYPVGTSISAPLVSRKLAEIKGNMPSSSATDVIQTFLLEYTATNTNFNGRVREARYLPVPSPDNNCQ